MNWCPKCKTSHKSWIDKSGNRASATPNKPSGTRKTLSGLGNANATHKGKQGKSPPKKQSKNASVPSTTPTPKRRAKSRHPLGQSASAAPQSPYDFDGDEGRKVCCTGVLVYTYCAAYLVRLVRLERTCKHTAVQQSRNILN